MSDLPKTKKALKFDDVFLEKISKENKTLTVRNSPIELGLYNFSNDLTLEVVSCKKVFVTCMTRDKITWFTKPKDGFSYQLYFKELGFNSKEDMFVYYKQYLKRNFAYIIKFIKV